ncbi:hypothetical protein ACLOJK_001063 [Asimina triloba]
MATLPQIPDVPVSTDRPSHLHYISSVRAFIFPPSSPSEATVRRAIDGLSLYLNLYDPVHLHQTLNLLRQISLLHPPFSPLVISSVLSFLHHRQPTAAGDRLLLDALVTLVSASAHGCSGGSLPATAGSILSSLLSSPTAAIRLRALKLMLLMVNSDSCSNYRNALLGFLKDPYPLVRRAALDGLVCVSKMDSVGMCSLMTEGMYGCIVQLLLEEDEVVRLGAIRMLCSMVRDMSMEIRVEAFLAVGRTRMVSEDVLLQTLSKKINQNESKSLRKLAGKGSMLSISSAAGAFVHGLEDEFYQVRRAACASMGSLIVFSLRFVDAAFDLLMDMLNDDVLDVRLQTLKTMLEMATYNHLKVQEKHMHMLASPALLREIIRALFMEFLNVLMDTNSSIRHATRKLLRVMKLANLEIYRSLIDGLLTSLRTYPEMGPSSKGELGLDRPRIAALLVLAIGATSNEQLVSGIPTEDSLSDQRQVSAPIKVSSAKEASLSEVTHSVKLILKTVADVWPLIKSGHREEVQDILRSCKEALLLISGQSDGSVSNFASQYIKLPTEVIEGHPEFCDFVKEVMHCCDGKNSEVSYPVPVSKLVDIFALEKIVFAGNFKQLKAVLHVLGNDSENPIPYIPGMPVGVTFQITLYNVSSEDRLWLMMALGDSVQYVFLDLCQFEGGEEVKKCTIEVPFYRTPKAASFTLQGCIGMESPSGDVTCLMRGQGGTKYKLIILSKGLLTKGIELKGTVTSFSLHKATVESWGIICRLVGSCQLSEAALACNLAVIAVIQESVLVAVLMSIRGKRIEC